MRDFLDNAATIAKREFLGYFATPLAAVFLTIFVAATGAFGVVRVNSAVFEGGDGGFHEAGLVERVGVDEDLDIVFVGDAGGGVSGDLLE